MSTKITFLLQTGVYCLILFSACKKEEISESKQDPESNNSHVDARDNQSYKTVQIGGQIWMAENLNYRTANSWCYEDKGTNCTKFGRLYTWEDAGCYDRLP